MSDKLVTIAAFPNTMLAAIARNKLEEAGIRSFLNDAESTALVFAGVINTVKLQVADEDAERASDILEEEDEQPPAEAFTTTPPGPGPEDLEPEIPEEKPSPADEAGNVPLASSPRDLWAERAYKATIIALFFWPMFFYSIALMGVVYFHDEPLRPDLRTRTTVAALINVGAAIAILLLANMIVGRILSR